MNVTDSQASSMKWQEFHWFLLFQISSLTMFTFGSHNYEKQASQREMFLRAPIKTLKRNQKGKTSPDPIRLHPHVKAEPFPVVPAKILFSQIIYCLLSW